MPKKILIVEDDPVMTQYIVLNLQQKSPDDYEVVLASDGKEGLELAKQFKPDLMVLDLAMPLMHGYEVCKAVRADPELDSIKIIVTSVKSYPADIKVAKQIGADKYLVKPYRFEELLAMMEELLKPPSS